MTLDRRSFFMGVGALLAVPAVVRAASLMPMRGTRLVPFQDYLSLVAKQRDGVVRILDEINVNGLASDTPPDLFALMSRSVMRLPDKPTSELKFVASEFVGDMMEVQAMRHVNVLLRPLEPLPPSALLGQMRSFRGIEIECAS